METSTLTFALAALLLIMIPGPDQALITRSTLVGGRKAGLVTMVGGVLGVTMHATLAAVGLSALLLASPKAFMVLKIVGTAYLLWMGVQTLRARRSTSSSSAPAHALRLSTAIRQGFLSNALNPKVALFFVTFLPQFLPTSLDASATRLHALLLSGVFALLFTGWFGLYVIVVNNVGRVLRRPRVKAAIERVTGVLLIAFAAGLMTA